MNDKRGLIIGSSSGIGRAIWRHLEVEASDVDWVTPDKFALDVSRMASVNQWFDREQEIVFGDDYADEPFDYVVFSAGVNYLEWIGQLNEVLTQEVLDVNLAGFIWVLDALLRTQPDHPARIVVIGSDAAERPLRTSISYCASKAGLHMAVRVAARELGPKGWRVNAVAPGMTDRTGMQEYVDERVVKVRGWNPEYMRLYESQQEVVPGRITVDEVAETAIATLFGADHLNGSIITINGGR